MCIGAGERSAASPNGQARKGSYSDMNDDVLVELDFMASMKGSATFLRPRFGSLKPLEALASVLLCILGG